VIENSEATNQPKSFPGSEKPIDVNEAVSTLSVVML